MRVIVTGTRGARTDEEFGIIGRQLGKRLELAVQAGSTLVVVHGDAPGVDRLAARWARDHWRNDGVVAEAHPADWRRNGRGAGPIRNQSMVDKGASEVLAFPYRRIASSGTMDCARKAAIAGIPVEVWELDTGDRYTLAYTVQHGFMVQYIHRTVRDG